MKLLRYLFLTLFFQFTILVNAQSFVKNIGNLGINDGVTGIQAYQNQILISGYSGKDAYLALADTSGNIQWKKYFSFSSHINYITDFIVDESTIYFCGYGHNQGSTTFDEFFVSYNLDEYKINWARKTHLHVKPNNIQLNNQKIYITGDEFDKGTFGVCLLELNPKNGKLTNWKIWYYSKNESASTAKIYGDKLFTGGRYGIGLGYDKYRAAVSQFSVKDFSHLNSYYFLHSKKEITRAYLADFEIEENAIFGACFSNNKGIDNKYTISLFESDHQGVLNWAYEYFIPGYQSISIRDMKKTNDGFYYFANSKSPVESLLFFKTDREGYPVFCYSIANFPMSNIPIDQGQFILEIGDKIYLAGQTKSFSNSREYDSFLLQFKLSKNQNTCVNIKEENLQMLAYEDVYEGEIGMLASDTILKERNVAFELDITKSEIDKFSCQDIEIDTSKAAISFENIAFNNTVFLMDASLSMNKEDRLPILKSSLFNLLDYMRADDKISVVQYSDETEMILDAVSAANKEEIVAKIEAIQPGGQSDIVGGLQLGFKTLKTNFNDTYNNRIILTTDGDLSFDALHKIQQTIKKNNVENSFVTIFLFNHSKVYYDQLKFIADQFENVQVQIINKSNVSSSLLQEFKAVRK